MGTACYVYIGLNVSSMAAKLHQGHAAISRDIQNGLILSGQPSYNVVTKSWLINGDTEQDAR
jgi:hypothetical protein